MEILEKIIREAIGAAVDKGEEAGVGGVESCRMVAAMTGKGVVAEGMGRGRWGGKGGQRRREVEEDSAWEGGGVLELDKCRKKIMTSGGHFFFSYCITHFLLIFCPTVKPSKQYLGKGMGFLSLGLPNPARFGPILLFQTGPYM